MRRRGLATVTALVAVVVVGCSSQGEVAGELPDIREVVAEAEANPAEEPPLEEDLGEDVSGEQSPGASAEAPEEPPQAEEIAEPDPDVDITTVPDEVTLEYVQAVLDELESILADALVLAMEEGELTLEIADMIGETFALRQRDIRLEEFADAASAGFPGVREPEDIELRRRIAHEILDQGDGCIYVHTITDDTPYFVAPVEAIDIYVLLETPTVERPVDINQTPWVYGSLGGGDEDVMRGLTPCTG